MEYQVVCEGLRFPEGPVWMRDGSIVLVEIESGDITRVHPDGRKERVAHTGGGPNGAAIGPDGRLYVCNNGGFAWSEFDGGLAPGQQPDDYSGGRIEAVDLATGAVEVLYDSCEGESLRGPNDIVFDAHGGFYFTDLGKSHETSHDAGGLFYALPDGSSIRRMTRVSSPNGCGLSPDGKTLYVAQTLERNILAFDLTAPGEAQPPAGFFPVRVITSFPGRQLLDSMAITADGHICMATIIEDAGIAQVDPATGKAQLTPFPDTFVTNICFGGEDMKDAWITLSATGRLVRMRWDRAGLRLNHYA
jgi:gluconolactonase